MKLTVIGNGNIGSGISGALNRAGHEATTVDQGDDIAAAVKAAEVVILATPYGAAADIAKQADFAGKTVVDLSNPITEDFSGLVVSGDTSAAESIAALLPDATVVKAFNTVFAQHYGTGLTVGGAPIQTYVASDDDAARDKVSALAKDIGLAPVNAGPLKNARYLEPLGFMNIQFGYVLGMGPTVAPQWISS